MKAKEEAQHPSQPNGGGIKENGVERRVVGNDLSSIMINPDALYDLNGDNDNDSFGDALQF